jgi:hypothetical protein
MDTKPTEGNQLEDFQQNGIDIKANYLIELKGRNGNIFSKKFYGSFRTPSTNDLIDNWELIHDLKVDAATDTSHMEAQIDLVELTKLLGINPNEFQNPRIYYQMTDWSDGKDIGIKLPVFNGELSDLHDELVEYEDSPGTRAPPGDWPSQWVTLDTNEGNEIDGPGSNNFDIFDLYANDSKYLLYLKIELQGLIASAAQYTTYDFYFNVTATKWYRIRIYRNSSTTWNLTLNYTTSASVPDDNNTWIMEEEYNELTVNEYDGLGCGFKYAAIASELAFWINKTNLSQGFGSLYKPKNCTMFADTHQQNSTQLGQTDRAPDSGIAWYDSTADAPVIPEYNMIILPIFTMLIVLALVNTKRKNRKRVNGILGIGGDCK